MCCRNGWCYYVGYVKDEIEYKRDGEGENVNDFYFLFYFSVFGLLIFY